MSAGKASKPIVERRTRISTDGPRYKILALVYLIANSADGAAQEARQVWVASSKKIRPRLAKEVLRSICEEEGDC